MRVYKKILAAGIMIGMLTSLTACKGGSDKPETNAPVNITVWHYYNGTQQEAFNALVEEFNNTEGREKGIIVTACGQGNVNDLENNVMAAINKEAGADEVPDIFAAYSDTAYKIDKLGYIVDLKKYLTDDEISEYIESYIEEGDFLNDGTLKIFPVAKSTEVFILNTTDWEKFSRATGTNASLLETVEGITETAEKYYEWTDSLTEEPNDGKAFFGRDAMANYIIISFRQMGKEIFEVTEKGVTLNFDKDIARKIWDNYYVPYIKGHFASSGRFRSDDIKTGNIISFVGSSSSATFFPNEVILSDNESYEIGMACLPAPKFENGEDYAVQQGAGMVVTTSDEKREAACVEFLKWFTDEQNNIQYSVSSGYLPVKKAANNIEIIEQTTHPEGKSAIVVKEAINMVINNIMYTAKAFENGTEARNILEHVLSDKAEQDREAVLEYMAGGMEYEEAIELFDNDENFDVWYNETKAALEKVIY